MLSYYACYCRPGLLAFLETMAAKYEMHVYTMGTRAYAEEVCAAIDPGGKVFGNRILSRDESGSKFRLRPPDPSCGAYSSIPGLTQKSLHRLFPCDQSMVVIIDDRADVWEWSPNLVKVVPCESAKCKSPILARHADSFSNRRRLLRRDRRHQLCLSSQARATCSRRTSTATTYYSSRG